MQLVITRLQQAVSTELNNPSFYNKVNNAHRHFLYQILADPTIGSQDETLPLVSRLLGINQSTMLKCADERKDHGIGYYHEPEVHGNSMEKWLVQVHLIYVVSHVFLIAILTLHILLR